MSNLETIVRQNLYKVLRPRPKSAEDLDLGKRFTQEFGLSSLDRILLMTAVCDELDISLMMFGEEDVANLTTPRNLIDSLQSRLESKGEAHVLAHN